MPTEDNIFSKLLGRVIYHSVPLPRVKISLEGFLGEPIGHVCKNVLRHFFLAYPCRMSKVLYFRIQE